MVREGGCVQNRGTENLFMVREDGGVLDWGYGDAVHG